MSPPVEIIVIFCTAPGDKSASLAKFLIDRRLAACVNVVPVRSYYRWKGDYCDEEEHLLIIKTSKEKTGEIIAAIKTHHPYELPEIIALPVIDGHLPYLEWVHEETQQ
ncbi:MAG: divalent-cation tolerance protein CutA [Methanoregula sp.]|nr:divalent-cation tolerance protein CutA [Methanoregula sp.]